MSILSDLFKTNNKEGTDLNEEEQKAIKEGSYDESNFEEEDLEDDDYYYDDKEEE